MLTVIDIDEPHCVETLLAIKASAEDWSRLNHAYAVAFKPLNEYLLPVYGETMTRDGYKDMVLKHTGHQLRV